MKRKNLRVSIIQKAAVCMIAAFLLASCGRNIDEGPVTANDPTEAPSVQEKPSVPKTNPYEGVWYEQSVNASQIEIKGSAISYTHAGYTDKTTFSVKKKNGTFHFTLKEEWFSVIDIEYDPDSDVLIAHTLPHTDGDGGYHLLTYKRTEYVAPPPPVYGDRNDNSDLDAVKEFSDYTISELKYEVYEPWVSYGDMTMEPPQEGQYAYELVVEEDGQGNLSSDFCRTITISEEKVKEIEALLKTAGFAEANGVDIWTEEMPPDTKWFEITVHFANGETLHTRANGPDIPLSWGLNGRQFHQLLFYCFVDAGYNMWSGEFHSVEPMRRFGSGKNAGEAFYSVTSENIKITKDGTVHKYTADAQYPAFTVSGSEQLQKTLDGLTEKYKALAESDLDQLVLDIDSISKSAFKKEDRALAYLFYLPYYRQKEDDLLFQFWIEEGHCNSFGAGEYGYGYYPNWRYVLDPKTGEILSVKDLFKDPDALKEKILEVLNRQYDYESAKKVFSDESYQKELEKALSVPETDGGIGMETKADGLTLYMPEKLSYSKDHSFVITLYYDEIQEIMAEEYSSVW